MSLVDTERQMLEEASLSLIYDLFLALRPESWRVADDLWLTPTQVAIITVLASHRGPCHVTQIARELRCSHSVVSRSLANLEYKACIRMRRNPRDRRRTLVEIRSAFHVARAARMWFRRVPDAVALLTFDGLTTLRDGLAGLMDQVQLVDRFRRGW